MESLQRTSRSANAERQAKYRSNFVAKLDEMVARHDEHAIALSVILRKLEQLEKQQRDARK
jgi:hypothetical protein